MEASGESTKEARMKEFTVKIQSSNQKRSYLPEILLGLAALFWGATFVVVKEAVATVNPLFFIGARFFLAAAMLVLAFPRVIARNLKSVLKSGLILGSVLTVGYVTQTIGLQHTSASASGFITGLSIVLVALFVALLTGRWPGPVAGVGILSGTAGLLLLGMRGGAVWFSPGDLLTLVCAFGFALHITLTGLFAPASEPITLSAVQFAAVALLTLGYSAVSGHFELRAMVSIWPSVVFTGVFASGLAFLFQTVAQRHTPADEAAVILAAEPLFAALFARIFLNESAGWRLIVGGGLIVLGMILTSIRSKSAARPNP